MLSEQFNVYESFGETTDTLEKQRIHENSVFLVKISGTGWNVFGGGVFSKGNHFGTVGRRGREAYDRAANKRSSAKTSETLSKYEGRGKGGRKMGTEVNGSCSSSLGTDNLWIF